MCYVKGRPCNLCLTQYELLDWVSEMCYHISEILGNLELLTQMKIATSPLNVVNSYEPGWLEEIPAS